MRWEGRERKRREIKRNKEDNNKGKLGGMLKNIIHFINYV
jgi:hypothetical protein